MEEVFTISDTTTRVIAGAAGAAGASGALISPWVPLVPGGLCPLWAPGVLACLGIPVLNKE